MITSITALFATYALLSLLAILTAAAISYAVYRSFGSHSSFNDHISPYLELTFLDFIAVFAVTFLILSAPKDYLKGVDYFKIVIPIMWLVLFGIRFYYLIVGYWAMRSIHALTVRRATLAFVIGFMPSYLIINALGLGLSWLLAVLFVIGGD